jgi:hypothetical protein
MTSDSSSPVGPVEEPRVPTLHEASRPARASVRLSWGNARFQADAEISPLGLLAIGGIVGVILLAVAPIVRAAIVRAAGRTVK